MKLKALLFFAILTALPTYAGTITGQLQGPSGIAVRNATLTFQLQQAGLIIGSGNVAQLSSQCWSSNDGSVVGVPNPLALPVTSVNYGSGSLPAGTYYVKIAYYTGATATLPSPEATVQLTSQGSLIISAPTSFPPGAAGFIAYIGTSPGTGTGQGQTTGSTAAYMQSTAISTQLSPVTANNTVCNIAFNDTIIPYTGYNVSLISATGNAYPGWPQAWQLNGGPSGTVNISNGAPLWNGTVVYPMPILSQPLNHGPQSISGLLNMTGYNLVNVGNLGAGGNSLPAYPIDVIGFINSTQGYLINGAAPNGHYLCGNGTAYVDSATTCSGSSGTIYYQHMQRNGGLFAQEPFLNFSTDFSLADNPGSTRTEVGLLATGVTPGSYTNTNLTVDANGRITTATNGNPIPNIQPLVITSGICTTAASAFATCNFTPTWGTAFADTNYSVVCGSAPGQGTNAVLVGVFVSNKTTTGFEVTLQNADASGAGATTTNEIDCVGFHP